MRFAWFVLLVSFPLLSRAQNQPPAPIERQPPASLPNAPQPAPVQAQASADQQWERLMRSTHYLRPEVRIQAVGDTVRCDLDQVTAEEIFCTEHRSRGIVDLFIPREKYHVPRRDIRVVRTGGRMMSTLLGAGIGIGVGAGLGSINPANRADGGPAYFGLLFGGIGALIGHALSMTGRPIYEQP